MYNVIYMYEWSKKKQIWEKYPHHTPSDATEKKKKKKQREKEKKSEQKSKGKYTTG